MTVPIQFISLTQEEYDNLGAKQDGKLYFTSDTKRIYKGSELFSDTDFSNFVKLRSQEEQQIISDIQINGLVKVGELQVSQGHYYPLFYVIEEIHDRAINIIDENTIYQIDPITGEEYLPLPNDFTDLLIRVDVPEDGSLKIGVPQFITKTFGDVFPGKIGSYLVTITKISTSEMLVRSIELEEAE